MSSPLSPAERLPTDWKSDAMRKRIARRYAAERRFRLLGLGAVLLSAAFLAFLLVTMMGNGLRGFTRTEIALKVDFPASPLLLDPQAITDEALANANLPMVTSTVAEKMLGKEADAWLAPTAWISVRDAIKADPTVLNRTEIIRVPASTDIDLAAKSDGSPEAEAAVKRLNRAGILSTGFNWSFLSASDGTDPTQVGIWGAFKGSLLTMLGIIIGVAAVIVLVAFGNGLQRFVADAFGPVANQIQITPDRGGISGGGTPRDLTDADVRALRDRASAPAVASVSPTVTR